MKKGISLVALVITIIVLIILTATVIIPALKDNGIFSNANQAVKLNNTEVLYEKIIKMNTDFMLEKNVSFTSRTVEILHAILMKTNEERKNIDLDKLGVYVNPYDSSQQLVVYRWDKVTKDDIAWFLNNTFTIEIDGQQADCYVYPLMGDTNFNLKIDEEDYETCRFASSNSITKTETLFVLLNFYDDDFINSTDLTKFRSFYKSFVYVDDDNTISRYTYDNGSSTGNIDYNALRQRIQNYLQ